MLIGFPVSMEIPVISYQCLMDTGNRGGLPKSAGRAGKQHLFIYLSFCQMERVSPLHNARERRGMQIFLCLYYCYSVISKARLCLKSKLNKRDRKGEMHNKQ